MSRSPFYPRTEEGMLKAANNFAEITLRSCQIQNQAMLTAFNMATQNIKNINGNSKTLAELGKAAWDPWMSWRFKEN